MRVIERRHTFVLGLSLGIAITTLGLMAILTYGICPEPIICEEIPRIDVTGMASYPSADVFDSGLRVKQNADQNTGEVVLQQCPGMFIVTEQGETTFTCDPCPVCEGE